MTKDAFALWILFGIFWLLSGSRKRMDVAPFVSSIRDPNLINRLYVVNGNSRLFGETRLNDMVCYPTDPEFYGLEIQKPLLFRHVRAYREEDDAVNAIYRCGLEPYGALLLVFRRIDGSWAFDEAETCRILDETPW